MALCLSGMTCTELVLVRHSRERWNPDPDLAPTQPANPERNLMKPSIPRLAASAAALLLTLSLVPIWPSGYYLLLTYIVGITAVLMVVRAQETKSQQWMMTWIVIAVLYNPIAPLRLPPSFQQLLNLVCAVLFFVCIRRFRL